VIVENRIWVSCATADKARAEEICKKLGVVGLDIEIDGILNDDEKAIENGIASARFFMIFFSNRSATESEALDKYLDIALRSAENISKDRVFIIPVRLEKCDIPKSVDHLQLIDLFKEEGFDQIVETIRGELTLFTDSRDGQVYRTIGIDGVIWLAENLNFEVTESWWYNNDRTNGRPLGRLYTWKGAQSACPSGWHIPTVAEWDGLASSVGGTWDFVRSATAYKALVEEGGGFRAMLGGMHEREPFDAFYERSQT
jgi:TIR domain/Fibrobacter succinogenes major domain (Fib_succ_major)